MREYLSGDDIANQICMMRSSWKGAVLVVEGSSDLKMYARFADPSVAITIAHSKEKVIEVVRLLHEKRKDDKVLGFTGSKSMTYDFPKDRKSSRDQLVKESLEEIPRMADKAGRLAANTFLSTWKEDFFYVIYYEGAEKAWNEAANLAYSFKWDQAIEKWFTLLDNKNAEKKACAAYNIAVGCFLSGQPSLALEWLDRYEKDMPGGLDKDLRRKIKEYAGI